MDMIVDRKEAITAALAGKSYDSVTVVTGNIGWNPGGSEGHRVVILEDGERRLTVHRTSAAYGDSVSALGRWTADGKPLPLYEYSWERGGRTTSRLAFSADEAQKALPWEHEVTTVSPEQWLWQVEK